MAIAFTQFAFHLAFASWSAYWDFLILNDWIWLLDAFSLHNWNNLFPVNWNLNIDFPDTLANNWFIHLDNLGNGWAHFVLHNDFPLDVVWNVLLHVNRHLHRHLDGYMYWHLDCLADGHSLRNFNDIGHFADSGHGNLLDDGFLGAGFFDFALDDFGGAIARGRGLTVTGLGRARASTRAWGAWWGWWA